jgi:hypothetical protein
MPLSSRTDHFSSPIQRRSRDWLSGALVLLGFIALALLSGAAVGVGGAFFAAAIGGAICGIAFFFIPIRYVFTAQLLLVFLVVGQLQYFAGVGRAFWIPYLIGALLWVRLPLLALSRGVGKKSGLSRQRGSSWRPFELAMMVFALIVAASTLLNQSPLLQVFVSIKEYLYLWSFFFVVALGYIGRSYLDRMWRALLWILPIQFPVIVYQHFFIAKKRMGGAAWDAIVGLFGGNPESGGASGAMAIFTVVMLLLAISLRKRKLLPGWQFALFILTGIGSLALAEVKVVLILIPIGIAALYADQLLKRPLRAVGMFCVSLGVAFLVLVAYQTQFQGDGAQGKLSLEGYVQQMLDRTTNTSFVNLATGEMGRVSALTFWWQRHGMDQPVHLLVGHGVGSSRYGQMVVGEAAADYRFRIDRSSLAILLWETGLVGAAGFAAILLLGSVTARRVARVMDKHDPAAAATLHAIAAGLLVFFLGLPYNTDMANVAQIQLTAVIMLAYVAYFARITFTSENRGPVWTFPSMAASGLSSPSSSSR